jgi:hypothetical protein
MMKKLMMAPFAFFLVLAASAQERQVEDPNAEIRKVNSFRAIKVSDGIDLYLSQADEDKVVVSASRDEYRSRIKTEVGDGVLKIFYDRESVNDWTSSGKKLKAYVSVRIIDKITAVAGSSVKVTGTIKEEVLNLRLNSGADFNGTVECGKLVTEIESGAKLDVKGAAGTFNVNASSGARVDAYALFSGKADIRSTTGAKVEVTVNDEVKLYSSTGGSIYYKGTAKITEVSTHIGAIIKKKD